MDQVADYLKRAEDAEKLARSISYEPDRASLLDIARSWRKLAEDKAREPKGRPQG